MRVTVLSCGLGDCPDHARHLIVEADVVYGSRKLLDAYAVPQDKGRVLGAHALDDAKSLLQQAVAGIPVLVLASGDALFHGMGGTLSRLISSMNPAPDVHFVPGVTAFQALFSRLGRPWDNAALFSAHHGNDLSLRCVLSAPLAVVYGGSRRTAVDLARELLVLHPQSAGRYAVLADSLGTPDEAVVTGTLGEIASRTASPTSILVLLPQNANTVPLALGLPVDSFEREAGLITAPDVRAVILSRLRLPAWGCLWDIGAGSGSVGLEAAALCPHLDVWAVERKPERVAMCQRNAAQLGVGNHRTLAGEFLFIARDLPDPDRIFFGGGGSPTGGGSPAGGAEAVDAMLDLGWQRLKPGGLMLLSAVTLETQHTVYGWHPERRTALCSVAVTEERPLAGRYHHLEPQRPIHLYCYCKPERPIC